MTALIYARKKTVTDITDIQIIPMQGFASGLFLNSNSLQNSKCHSPTQSMKNAEERGELNICMTILYL